MDIEKIKAAYAAALGQFTVLLAITDGLAEGAEAVVNNGTGSLIDTGTGKFLVTNHHVYDWFRKRREANPQTKLLMSGGHGVNYLDISFAEVRALDQERDLAVLRIPAHYIESHGKRFYECSSWPPPRPEAGLLAIVHGYPGQGRVPQGETLGARPTIIFLGVADVRGSDFVIADISDDAVLTVPDGAEPLTCLGGMSGSAVYVIRKKPALIVAGFMYAASASMSYIFATHADHLNADGTIGSPGTEGAICED
jgi:hypothetical protein